MKNVLWTVSFVLVILSMSGCKTQKAMLSFTGLEGEWNLVELNGHTITSADYRPFFLFDMAQKRYSGSAGCNRMSGELAYDEGQPGKLKFGRALTTRMACPALDAEQAFLSAMEKVVRFGSVEADTKQVVFYDENDKELFTVEKK